MGHRATRRSGANGTRPRDLGPEQRCPSAGSEVAEVAGLRGPAQVRGPGSGWHQRRPASRPPPSRRRCPATTRPARHGRGSRPPPGPRPRVRDLQQPRRGVAGTHDHLHTNTARPDAPHLGLERGHRRARRLRPIPAGRGRLIERGRRHVLDHLQHRQRPPSATARSAPLPRGWPRRSGAGAGGVHPREIGTLVTGGFSSAAAMGARISRMPSL
jgi:hypothetical protein